MSTVEHHYIDRSTGTVRREQLLANGFIRAMYSPTLEKAAV